MSKFVKTSYGNSKEILKFNQFTATSVIVSDEGITAVDGKKIVKAGTIVGGGVFDDPNMAVSAHNDATAEGVLLTDVDVTHGPATGSMVIFGFIKVDALPEVPDDEAKTALSMIKFMK